MRISLARFRWRPCRLRRLTALTCIWLKARVAIEMRLCRTLYLATALICAGSLCLAQGTTLQRQCSQDRLRGPTQDHNRTSKLGNDHVRKSLVEHYGHGKMDLMELPDRTVCYRALQSRDARFVLEFRSACRTYGTAVNTCGRDSQEYQPVTLRSQDSQGCGLLHVNPGPRWLRRFCCSNNPGWPAGNACSPRRQTQSRFLPLRRFNHAVYDAFPPRH